MRAYVIWKKRNWQVALALVAILLGCCEASEQPKTEDAGGESAPDQSEDDARPVPPYRYQLQELLGIGSHTGDFSVVMDDLIDSVEQQANAMPVASPDQVCQPAFLPRSEARVL